MFTRVIVVLAVVVVLGMFFAERGVIDNYKLKQTLAEEEFLARRLLAENEELRGKVHLLKNDRRYVEMVARSELGMVAAGETVVHVRNSTNTTERQAD